jgi:hypothetical protein
VNDVWVREARNGGRGGVNINIPQFRRIPGWLVAVVAISLAVLGAVLVGTYLLQLRLPDPSDQNSLLVVAFAVVVVTATAALLAGRLPLYRASLIRTAVWLPGVVAIISIALYLILASSGPESPSTLDGLMAALIGTGFGFASWLLYAALNTSFSGARSANARNYTQLQSRLSELETVEHDRLIRLGVDPVPHAAHIRIKDILATEDERWVLATGYLDAWEAVHRAEEQQLRLTDPKSVVSEAFRDWMRLRGSNIPQAESLRDRIRTAVGYLDGHAAPYFIDPIGLVKTDVLPDVEDSQRNAAREMVANIRATINVYREERYDRLVRARNALVVTTAFTALVADLGLGLALIVGVPTTAVVAAASYFVVGAVVGLLVRLRADATRNVAMEDMGLSTARLIHTPLLSGIAAIAGVALIALATQVASAFSMASAAFAPETASTPSAASSPAPQSLQPAGADTAASSVEDSVLVEIFDVAQYPVGLVVAAVFGFAPILLLRGLQRQVDQYKVDLAASEPSAGGRGEEE